MLIGQEQIFFLSHVLNVLFIFSSYRPKAELRFHCLIFPRWVELCIYRAEMLQNETIESIIPPCVCLLFKA